MLSATWSMPIAVASTRPLVCMDLVMDFTAQGKDDLGIFYVTCPMLVYYAQTFVVINCQILGRGQRYPCRP